MPEIDKKQRFKNRMLNYFVNYFFFIVFVVFIILSMVALLFILWPKYRNSRLSVGKGQLNMNNEIETKKFELASLESSKKGMDVIDKDNLIKLNSIIPSKENVSYVIKELNTIATDSGFFLTDVKYSKSGNNPGAVAEEQNNKSNLPVFIKFFTFNITITGGGYENLKSFLKMTADSVNIRDVTSIRFDGKNSYDIELKAYYYEKEESAQMENIEFSANIEAAGSDANGSRAVNEIAYIEVINNFFKRESFMSLREYLRKEITIQKEVVPATDDFPPPPKDAVVYNPGAGGKLNIFWDKSISDKIDKTRIYRFEDLDGKGVMIAEIDKTENTFADTTLVNGKKYYYLVKNVNKQGQMSKNTEKYSSTPENIIPPGMLLDIFIEQTKEGIGFIWQNPSDEDLAYIDIYRSKSGFELGDLIAKLKAVPSQKQKWSDNDIAAYEEYYYTILSVDNAGNSSPYHTIKLGNKNIFITSEGGE